MSATAALSRPTFRDEPWVWVRFTCQVCGYVERYPTWFTEPLFDEAFVCFKCEMAGKREQERAEREGAEDEGDCND